MLNKHGLNKCKTSSTTEVLLRVHFTDEKLRLSKIKLLTKDDKLEPALEPILSDSELMLLITFLYFFPLQKKKKT